MTEIRKLPDGTWRVLHEALRVSIVGIPGYTEYAAGYVLNLGGVELQQPAVVSEPLEPADYRACLGAMRRLPSSDLARELERRKTEGRFSDA